MCRARHKQPTLLRPKLMGLKTASLLQHQMLANVPVGSIAAEARKDSSPCLSAMHPILSRRGTISTVDAQASESGSKRYISDGALPDVLLPYDRTVRVVGQLADIDQLDAPVLRCF